jgi:hypothetical protein
VKLPEHLDEHSKKALETIEKHYHHDVRAGLSL